MLFKDYDIKTVVRFDNKLDKFMKLGKDKLGNLNQYNAIYKTTCFCGMTYISPTKRPLHMRVKEHKNNIKQAEKYHRVIRSAKSVFIVVILIP